MILTNLGQAHGLPGNKASSTKCYQNIKTVLAVIRERKGDVVFGDFFMSTTQLILNPLRVGISSIIE
jgi:hypothetical protein